MSGIIKVIVSFFRKGEEVAIDRHRSRVLVDKDKHTRVFEFKKHLTEFLGLNEQALQFGVGAFSLKLFRLAKIVRGQMRELCYSNRWEVATKTAKYNIS